MDANNLTEKYTAITKVLSDLSYSMYKEHWSDIQIVEEDGKYSEAIDASIILLKDVSNLIVELQQKVNELENANKDSSELDIYRDILSKL